MIYTAMEILGMLIVAVGAIISLQCGSRKRNNGFRIIALWFTLSLVTMAIGRMREAPPSPDIGPQANQLSPGVVRVPVRTAELPIMPAILVAGVWLAGRTGKQDLKQNTRFQQAE
jgi:hypothetical protein